ncbi:MAG: hypothetical protein WEA04_00355 [Candidatus Andersenbacteria bacterium]
MTWPVAASFTTHVAGIGGDPWQTMWRFMATAEHLDRAAAGEWGEYVIQEFLGGGSPRLVNLSVWPWLWLQPLFGQPLTYNLVWLLSFIISGWGMYALCRYLIHQLPSRPPALLGESAALLGGMVYMFLPYHFAHALGHFGALQLQWLPLFLLVLHRLRDRWRWRDCFWLALLLVIQVWTEHHYALWVGLFTVIFVMWYRRTFTRHLTQSPARFWGGVVILLVAVTVVLVSNWPTIRLAASTDEALVLGQEQTIRFSADPFAYIIPAVFHPLWGGLVATYFAQYFTGNVAEATHFLGIVPLLLFLFFHQQLPRNQKYFWVTTALVFGIISLGPRLHLMGIITPLPLPFALIDRLPVVSAVRTVARASVMVGLSLSVLVALVVATQFKRQSLVAVVAAAILLEFLAVPIPLQAVTVSPVYASVRSLPGEVIIEIPAATNYVTASRALYASLFHGKTVMGNIALERGETPAVLDEARSLPALRQLLYLRTNHLALGRSEFFGQDMVETAADGLRAQKVAAIILHLDSVTPHQATILREFLEQQLRLVPQSFDDAVLYTTPESSLPPSDGIFMQRGEGWGYAYDAARQATFAEITQPAEVIVTNTHSQARSITLAFSFGSQSHRQLQITQAGEVMWQAQGSGTPVAVEVHFTVPPGKTTLGFANLKPEKLILQNPALSTP